jgi:hypothetical protein
MRSGIFELREAMVVWFLSFPKRPVHLLAVYWLLTPWLFTNLNNVVSCVLCACGTKYTMITLLL